MTLHEIEAYYDAVPRVAATAEDVRRVLARQEELEFASPEVHSG